jgi:hypothetical protein
MPKQQPRILSNTAASDLPGIQKRLDAIVLLLSHSLPAAEGKNLKISAVAPLLHLAGYTPTEIAKLFGMKRATDLAKYLYIKKR